MFFKDIDSWSPKKLKLVTLAWAIAYFVFAAIIPVIIVASKYNVFGKSSFKLTAAALIVIIIIISVGVKAFKWLTGIMPESKKSQQILKYSIQLFGALLIPLLILWIVHLIQVDMQLALSTLTYCVYSYIVAIAIQYLGLRSLEYQWKKSNELDDREKLDRMQAARNKQKYDETKIKKN